MKKIHTKCIEFEINSSKKTVIITYYAIQRKRRLKLFREKENGMRFDIPLHVS